MTAIPPPIQTPVEQRLAQLEARHTRTRTALIVIAAWVVYQTVRIPSLVVTKKVRAEEYGLDVNGKYYGRLLVGADGPEFWTTQGNVVPLLRTNTKETETLRTTSQEPEGQ